MIYYAIRLYHIGIDPAIPGKDYSVLTFANIAKGKKGATMKTRTHQFTIGPKEAEEFYQSEKQHEGGRFVIDVIAGPIVQARGQRFLLIGAEEYYTAYELRDWETEEGHAFAPAILPDGRGFGVFPEEGESGIAYLYYSPSRNAEMIMTIRCPWIHRREFEQWARGETVRQIICPNCGGTGRITLPEHDKVIYCQTCDGTGLVNDVKEAQ